jgi:CRISPR-associated protein Cas1
MLKRSLVFTTPFQLSLRNGQIVINTKEMPSEQRTVPIEDVGVVLIEHQQVNITVPLMNALVDGGVGVILCDAKGMPHAMIQNLDGNNLQGELLRKQTEVGEVLKKQLWKQIVESKIRNQASLLQMFGKDAAALKPLYQNVKSGDSDNREGLAARLYWTLLFGDDFTRDRTLEGINVLLNYGYAILRAATARALVSSGLTPALGIFHHNRSNAFPLADDMMEPYRPFVDMTVYHLCEEGKMELNKETKASLINVLYCDTHFPKVVRPLQVGLSMTMASLARCYSGEEKTLQLPTVQ